MVMQAVTGAAVSAADAHVDTHAGRLATSFEQPLLQCCSHSQQEEVTTFAAALLRQWGNVRAVRAWHARESACLTHAAMLVVAGLRADGVQSSAELLQALLEVSTNVCFLFFLGAI